MKVFFAEMCGNMLELMWFSGETVFLSGSNTEFV